MLDAIEAAFYNAVSEVKNVDGKMGEVIIHSNLQYESFVLADDRPCVLASGQAAIREIGLEPQRAIVNGGLDANWLTARGIPSVTMGCGQRAAHRQRNTEPRQLKTLAVWHCVWR